MYFHLTTDKIQQCENYAWNGRNVATSFAQLAACLLWYQQMDDLM